MNDAKKRDFIEKIAGNLNMNGDIKAEFLKAAEKKHPIMKTLVLILNADVTERATKLLHLARIHMLYQFRAEGTANSELLDLLGLGRTGKIVSVCFAPHPIVDELLVTMSKELRLRARGNGIAFTLPMSGAASPIMKLLDEETREKLAKRIESEVEKMKVDATHELIVSVVNPGYSEDLMEVAKAAGATGGTVIHARQVGREEATKVWGISLQGEREIIAILTTREQKVSIMKAINSKYGITSEASGITIALPADAVEGLEG